MNNLPDLNIILVLVKENLTLIINFLKMPSFFKKTFCSLLIISVFVCFKISAQEERDIYTVEDVAVNVSGNSPAGARNLAMKAARKDAFMILLTRLSLDIAVIDSITEDEIMDMVRSEQVFNEKILGNNYIGSFTIVFAKDFVDNVLARKNTKEIVKTHEKPLSFVIIPVEVLQEKNLLWESGNNWRKYVSSSIIENKARNFRVIEDDIENITLIDQDNISRISAIEVEPLFSKYKVDIVYVAFFSYDDQKQKASVLIRGFDKLRRFQYRLGFLNSDNMNLQDLQIKVAGKMMEYLSKLKTEDIRMQGIARDILRFEIPVTSLSQWLLIKNIIENSGLVSKVSVESISRDYVYALASYGSSAEASYAFDKIGISLFKKGNNNYLLTLKNSYQ